MSNPETLARDWRHLQYRANTSVFTDWLWICTWLESYGWTNLLLVRTTLNGELVALGLFSKASETRHKVLHSQVAYLHQTGQHQNDQIWIEYNGLLALPGHEVSALVAAINALFAAKHCDEVHLSMLTAHQAQHLSNTMANGRIHYEVPGYKRNLKSCHQEEKSVIESLTANTRYQVRRSLRLYEENYGPASLTHAANIDEAITLFNQAGHWHKARWTDSGFNNRAFTGFHEALIKRGFDHGSVKLSRLAFGDELIGVFYCLVHNKQVFFYLQGLRSEQNSKLKPGLCGHSLLMQYFLEQGMDVYDFMGGGSQYKRQLCDQQNSFMTVRIHSGHIRYRLEDQARRIKHRFIRT